MPELGRTLVDLAILGVAIVILVYAVSRKKAVRPLYPLSGLIFLVFGTGLFLVAHLGTVIGPLMAEASGQAPSWILLPEWAYWTSTRIAYVTVLVGLVIGTAHRKRLERDVVQNQDYVRTAQSSILQSENRFRALFETTSNSIYCYTFDPPMPVDLPVKEQIERSHDAVLTECNHVFARELRARSPQEVIGTRMGILDGNKDTEAHEEYFGAFITNDYRLSDYELIYKTPRGEERAVRSSLTGIVTEGLLHRVWGAESNILDLRETKAALRHRQRFERLLAKTSSALVIATTEKADEVLTECIERLCRYFGSDRMTIFWMDTEKGTAEVAYSWGVPGDTLTPTVLLVDFPNLAREIRSGRIARIDDVASMPADMSVDRKALQARSVRSFIAVPLVVGGETVGALSIACRRNPRSWADSDVDEIRVFGELLANFVHRLNSQRSLDAALAGLQKATERLEAENVYLRGEIEDTHGFDEIIGDSPAIVHCLRLVEQVAETDTPVLVLGETGTGKELIARAIHDRSNRASRPLVKVNCAALPGNLIESELFGYEKGAFTGAERSKRGRFEIANGSTMFLDEIGEIPLDLQAKLLRVLQEGEFERLGGTRTMKVDVRIIAATNRDLAQAVMDGEFRSDLFYRINTFPIELPPLRARGNDIQLLAEHFINVHSKNLRREVTAMSANMMQRLRDYPWPGNVRELESVIQRALISSSGPVLELPLRKEDSEPRSDSPRVLSTTIADLRVVERDHILAVLEESQWKIAGESGAAAKLGIPPSTLRSKMKRLAIVRPEH